MRGLFVAAVPLLSALLVGCGTLSTAPTAGQLLDAPTALNLTGRMLSAEAAPTLSGNVFSVRVRVTAARAALPGLSISNVYVVTNDGVWASDIDRAAQWKCGTGCALALGRGPAGEVQAGETVQVVVGLKDAKGRPFLLRDAQARIK